MSDVVVLQWTFSPPDYFEEPIHIDRETYSMVIENGEVEARIDPGDFDPEHNMRDDLHEELNGRFLAAQVFSNRPYELSGASARRIYADGRECYFLFAKSLVVPPPVLGSPDILVRDQDGNIVGDSRQDRIDRRNNLGELVAKYISGDQLLRSLLASRRSAVYDPNNELVHLYEIRDALAHHFRSNRKPWTVLGMSRRRWSRLGQLANDEPLRQGRHRGANVGQLRDATEAELKEARGIAQDMIVGYLDYLENTSGI
jgi:hypothetical protein